MKRLISVLLSISIVVVSLFSIGVTSFAEEKKCGESISFSFDDSGKIKISGEGYYYNNAKDILYSAENDRYNESVGEIVCACDSREKEINAKLTKIIVDGYYEGTEKEYNQEITAIVDDMNALSDLINYAADETEKAGYETQYKQKQKEYNRLVILSANRKQKDILDRELSELPTKKQNSLNEAENIHNGNITIIDNTLKNAKFEKDKPAPTAPTTKKKTAKKITVKRTAIKNIKGKKKCFTVSWKKVKGVTGYQIQYSTTKKFTKKTTKKVTVKKAKTLKRTVKKLKKNKKYYVRIRAYKKYKGKVYYSKWSKAVRVKTK